MAKIAAGRENEQWRRYQQMQPIARVWSTKDGITHYQQWVQYRSCTLKLNQYHAARALPSECPLNAGCRRMKETTAHILWECEKAETTWNRLLTQWTEQRRASTTADERRQAAMQAIAMRTTPPSEPGLVKAMQTQYGFVSYEHVAALGATWFTLTTVMAATLWQARNETVHGGRAVTLAEVAEQGWHAGLQHVRAISERSVRS